MVLSLQVNAEKNRLLIQYVISPQQRQITMNNTQSIDKIGLIANTTSLIFMEIQRQAHHLKCITSNQKKRKGNNPQRLEQSSLSCYRNELDQVEILKINRKISDHSSLLGQSKFKAHREKFNRIKAKQIQIAKKAQSLLSNSGSSTSNSNLKHTQSSENPSAEETNSVLMNSNKKTPCQPLTLKSNKNQIIKIKSVFGIEVFNIIKFINEGCYGKVYLVTHETTGLIFSLKIIDRNFLDETTFSQLIREIKIQSFISHPNIINLYQFFVDQNNVYLLLEPCLGGNLYQLMNKKEKKCLEQKQAKRYVKQIGSALQYLHKQSIIHRDIKPENILIHENSAKLCDFGWAVYSPLLRDTQCGTPLYMCPEILKNESYDSKIDIWCIGVLTFELLYGEPPFKIRNINQMAKIVNEDVEFPYDDNISDSAIEFIRGCLQKNATKRFSIRRALEHDFVKSTRGNERFRSTIS